VDPTVLETLQRAVEQRFGVDALWVFGSVARGTDHEGSDVDLAALFAEPPAAADLTALQEELAALAGRPVDLVDLGSASPILAMQVLGGGHLLVERSPSKRVAFVAGLPSRYEDLKRLRAPMERALLERVRHGRA
jgi:hypothetical protein